MQSRKVAKQSLFTDDTTSGCSLCGRAWTALGLTKVVPLPTQSGEIICNTRLIQSSISPYERFESRTALHLRNPRAKQMQQNWIPSYDGCSAHEHLALHRQSDFARTSQARGLDCRITIHSDDLGRAA